MLTQIAHERVGPGRSSFAFFFEPVLPMFSTLYWKSMGGEWPVYSPVEEVLGPDFESSDAATEDGTFLPGVLVPKFQNRIIEDWISLIGMPEAPTNELLCKSDPLRDRQTRERFIRVALENIDGAFWFFFAHEEELIDTIRKHVQQLGSPFTAEPVDFECFLRDW
ncbi:MAG: hypothetical protein H6819_09015 [Phycisphaerales bacterium]|nr:hypothetical protein [Phycisphaerales bacterium]MCB9856032.1 hypothetical protein [Phycisphaerales bacterium]MCB9863940.1 hypothetical protein [Phycisphaerales bacterium]